MRVCAECPLRGPPQIASRKGILAALSPVRATAISAGLQDWIDRTHCLAARWINFLRSRAVLPLPPTPRAFGTSGELHVIDTQGIAGTFAITAGGPMVKLPLSAISALVPVLLWGLTQTPASLTATPTVAPTVVMGDEFVGPFASWTNLKTRYSAAGDGAADDTAAMQRALDDLGKQGHSPVLFLPSGTYRIKDTLVLAYNSNLSIVGEDPATTTIVWDGTPGGTMLRINGIAYSRIGRLRFDGRRQAGVAVEQSWDNLHPQFDTGNEYADDDFIDVGYGIHGGFNGHGFAETSVRRSHFLRNTRAGIALGNFNALDLWVWQSMFEDCYTGITNTPGAGNFHVYNSIFRRSTEADLAIGNTGGFSARGNYSSGSKAFFIAAPTNNPATVHLQGNTVIDPLEPNAIRFGNEGPGLLTDNVVRSLPSAVSPIVSWMSLTGADVVSIGNTFTVSNPVRANGRLVSIDDRVVARSAIHPVEPAMPGSLPNRRRRVFEVPRNADWSTIQTVIVAAARQKGSRPVIHFPYGTYSIAETLTLPIGDLQLVGDGYGTILRWTGEGAGPLLRVMGPSKTTLREIQIDGMAKVDGIVVQNVDQVGSRVYMDQVQLRSGKRTNMSVEGLDHTHVQMEDIGFAYSPDAVSIMVRGGPLSASGAKTGGRTNIFSGASSGNKISFDVSGGARVLARDLWYESGAGPGFARIHDRALFTTDGARISSPVNGSPPAFDITDLHGRVAIVSTHIDDRIAVSGDGSQAMVLGLGIFAEWKQSQYFLNRALPTGHATLINSRQLSTIPGTRSIGTTNVGVAEPAFLRMMLSHTRGESPAQLDELPAGVTDVRLFRVWVANGLNNIRLSAGPDR